MFTTIRQWLRQQVAMVDRAEVATAIDQDGRLQGSYMFMSAMASGIATIGLLCNSVSVIIGAMLVSPLMGPIVRLGLGLATLDLSRVFRALGTLIAGMALALAVAILIVWLSPLRTPTPEILARTTPNLFDMIAATLSGLAGAYAMIRNRGGAIVGVAIATALMPPMAVVGFGIAIAQWSIAKGALLLFTTNLVTIALSATLMSTWYGFSGRATRHAVAWQIVVGFAVLLPLGWPLAHALSDIAQQTRLLNTVRNTLTETLSGQSVRVLDLQLDNKGQGIDVTFAAQRYDSEENEILHAALQKALPADLKLTLNPVITADPSHTELNRSALGPSLATAALAAPATPASESDAIVKSFPLPLLGSGADAQLRQLTLVVAPTARAPLATLRQMEEQLERQWPGWVVRIVPPPRPLPPILFARGSAELGAEQHAALEDVLWALRRWDAHQVAVEGRASSDGRGTPQLAAGRAESVRQWLEQAGIEVQAGASYPLPDQPAREAADGVDMFRSVFIHMTDSAKTD